MILFLLHAFLLCFVFGSTRCMLVSRFKHWFLEVPISFDTDLGSVVLFLLHESVMDFPVSDEETCIVHTDLKTGKWCLLTINANLKCVLVYHWAMFFMFAEGDCLINKDVGSTPLVNGRSSSETRHLKNRLRFFFMNPIQKWNMKRRLPYKFVIQVIKIFLVTFQVIFCLARELWFRLHLLFFVYTNLILFPLVCICVSDSTSDPFWSGKLFSFLIMNCIEIVTGLHFCTRSVPSHELFDRQSSIFFALVYKILGCEQRNSIISSYRWSFSCIWDWRLHTTCWLCRSEGSCKHYWLIQKLCTLTYTISDNLCTSFLITYISYW